MRRFALLDERKKSRADAGPGPIPGGCSPARVVCRETRAPVADLHHFTAALRLGIDTFENGWLEEVPRRVYEQVVRRSAELDAVGKTLEQGGDLSGSTMQALMIYVKDAEAFVRSVSVG